jgi:hypothetical protein
MSSYLAGVPGRPVRKMAVWTDAEEIERLRLHIIRRLRDPDAKLTRNDDIGLAARVLEHCHANPEIN